MVILRAPSRRPLASAVTAAAAVAAVLLLAGCQAIFTYSPLSGLQRPPSSMTPEQRLTYAEDALASGNTANMQAAYDAIKNDAGADAQYLAAQLGIELSGVPDVLLEIASDPSTAQAQLSDIDGFIAAHNLDPTYMVDAAAQFEAAQAAGADLTEVDLAMAAIGSLLGGAQGAAWDITTLTQADQAVIDAQVFIDQAVADVASLPAGDPLKEFITQLNDFIDNDIP